MIDHVCHPPEYCYCDSQALEPNEECPVHGIPKPIDNCMVCGRFVKRNYEDEIGNQGEIKMTIQRDRFLTEQMGECWHEWEKGKK